jgi:hypothetical protein
LDLDLSLFDSDRIEVLKEDKKVGEVFVQTFSDPSRGVNILMDYSCSGYNLQVFGFEGHFVTVGCELIRETQEGEVVPSLRVYWSSNEYKTLDGSRGPYQITFTEAREARLLVQTNAGKKKEVFFKVKFPERLHRLRTSIGLGPHIYQTSKEELKTQEEVVPSFMLYGNYYLNNIHSLKFFEALIAKETIFNHAGLYVGSELGKFYDDRLVISSLIGLQALSHRYDSNDDAIFTQIIFPQGIELTVHHPFGMENYRFSIGGFLSPQSDVTYQNFWARFGTRTFIEFNFINWGYGNREAIMYGLSVGFPFLQF